MLKGNTIGFITSIKKTIHITWINDFFKQINIKKGYEKQILDLNIEKFNLMIRANLNMFSSTKILIWVN